MINRIGIIGGTGMMGQMFAQKFQKLGKEVFISDHHTIANEKDLVKKSDLIILSVPIHHTKKVIRRIRPWLTQSKLISDYTSVKTDAIPELLKTEASIISCHPMFGAMSELIGQKIILMPLRPHKFMAQYQRLYTKIGLDVIVLKDWKKHDEYMSIIQGLIHFFHIIFTQTLRNNQIDLDTILSICSPVYQSNFALSCRIMDRDPELYTHILIDNPKNKDILHSFLRIAHDYLKLIENRETDDFIRKFVAAQEYLGKKRSEFSTQSDFLIEKLKEFQKEKLKN